MAKDHLVECTAYRDNKRYQLPLNITLWASGSPDREIYQLGLSAVRLYALYAPFWFSQWVQTLGRSYSSTGDHPVDDLATVPPPSSTNEAEFLPPGVTTLIPQAHGRIAL